MKKILLTILIFFYLQQIGAQKDNLSDIPVSVFKSKQQEAAKPLIIYVSGDGGENTFSTDIVSTFNSQGYPVIFFNTLKYFWKKKDPSQAAADFEKVIGHYKNELNRGKIWLIGYSMGASVLPFIYNRLSSQTQALINNIVFISPSEKTDFEVHVSSLFSKDKGESVAAEMSKIAKPFMIIQGSDETDKMNTGMLDKRKFALLVLKGGHHYNANTDLMVKSIIQNIK